jgi:phosphohistidine phosphatase
VRTIILFRHAKSDRDAASGSDHERRLAKRGRQAARRMGRYLAALGEVPDRAISSSAVRALETVRLAAKAGAWSCPVEPTDLLYETSPPAALRLLRGLPARVGSVLLVGHEPTWSSLAGRLVGRAGLRLPTAAMARIDFEAASWSEVAFGGGTLVWLVTPGVLEKIGLP